MQILKKIVFDFINELKENQEFNNTELYKIYGLINPINNELFYIGCSKNEIHSRIYQHYNSIDLDWNNKVTKKKTLIELQENNIIPIVNVFFYISDKKTAQNIEKHLISFLMNNTYNVNLLNTKYSIICNEIL
jgi:hypothetical protein